MRFETPAVALSLVVALAGPAAAEPAWSASVRVAAAYGVLEETTWAYPEVDVVGALAIGERGYVALAAGLTPLDNHTYLSDGRVYRAAVAGGATVVRRIRAAVALGLESVSFHADPDVLADHAGVDILASRGSVIPSAGLEVSRPIGASTVIGVFTRIGLRELTLFDTGSGDRGRARLVLYGVFVELRIR